jgi:hypothetical protein
MFMCAEQHDLILPQKVQEGSSGNGRGDLHDQDKVGVDVPRWMFHSR